MGGATLSLFLIIASIFYIFAFIYLLCSYYSFVFLQSISRLVIGSLYVMQEREITLMEVILEPDLYFLQICSSDML